MRMTPTLTLEHLEARHLLASIDTLADDVDEALSATIDDDEALQGVINLIDAETDDPEADDDSSETKKAHSKNPLKRLKHTLAKDTTDLKHSLESKAKKLQGEVEASLSKLGEITHIEDIKAELSVIKEKLTQEAENLSDDLSKGLDKLKEGADAAKEKLVPILDLPSHLMNQISDPKEIWENLACLARIIHPDSHLGEEHSVEEKPTLGDNVSDLMHHHVDRLQKHTEHFVSLTEKMPEGHAKELLMQTLSTLADAAGSVIGKIADFNENHSDINERRLNRMIFEAHVASKLLKYGSWGLKLSSGVLKLVSIGVPEAIPVALATRVVAGFTDVGSQALDMLEGDLPHLASEKSKVVTGAAEAGHRAEDVWHHLAARLKHAGTVEEQQAALEEAMKTIAA